MRRTPVDSSSIHSIGYDPETRRLQVEFHSGKVYDYAGVEPAEHARLVAASSIGAHFAKHIRPLYDGRAAE